MVTSEDKSKENVAGDTDNWGNLVFQIGEESRPKIETLEEIGKSFFTDTYRNAFSLIEDIVKQSDNIRGNESKDRAKYERLNNIIAFIGERGAGKTSCMLTVHSILRTLPFADKRDNRIIQRLGNDGKNVAEKNIHMLDKSYLTMDLIDPSFFRDDNNILEIIIANMFKKFKSHAEDPKGRLDCEDDNHVEKKRVLIRSFQKVKDALDGMNYSRHTNDSIDGLNQMANTMELKQDIQALIYNYADYFRNPHGVLVIAVDDIDLQTTHAYRMIEQIRKYLILPNVVILMAVKLSQLTDIIRQHYYDEYKTLMSKDALSDSVENMTERYLTKLIPYEHRLYLPDLEINLSKQLTIKVGEKNLKGKIRDMVLTLIYKKTGYLFYNSSQQASLIIPRNLRDLLNLIAMLYHMDDLSGVDKSRLINVRNYNRHLFKKYFFETWCRENLESDVHTYLRELAAQDLGVINKLMISYLVSYCGDKNVELKEKENVINKENRAYNVSLGDVLYVLHEIETQSSSGSQKNVFAIKTLYTMLINEAHEEMILEQQELDHAFFGNLINQFSLETVGSSLALKQFKKFDQYSNYEKILGGEILYGEHKNPIIGDFSFHPKRIKTIILNDLFEELKRIGVASDRSISLPYETPKLTIATEHALNLLEFFILNISHGAEISGDTYRSAKPCYYDYLPFRLGTMALFDTSAVLFNIIKYYNYYRHLVYYDDNDMEQKVQLQGGKVWEDFKKFGKLIKNERSLFRSIYTESNEGVENSRQVRMRSLSPVYSMEMIDLLVDYLPFFSVSSDDPKFINMGNIGKFYRKLSRFRTIAAYPGIGERPETELIFPHLSSVNTFLWNMGSFQDDTLKLFNYIYNSVEP